MTEIVTIIQQAVQTVRVAQPEVQRVAVAQPGLPGPPASITPSADANNRTTVGSDGHIFTPDITVDPLAYYILAKA